MSTDPDFHVFREGRRSVRGEELLQNLRRSLRTAADESGWIDALLRAGELECGLEDAGAHSAELVGRVTDFCAERLVQREFRSGADLILPESLPEELTISTPEGFAYYALHPLRYGDAADELGHEQQAVVIGIRSIGTTLSAVVSAALRQRGVRAERFTVRPGGHPFDRKLQWSDSQLGRVRKGVHSGVAFLVVDEGPGLSGSSILAVAEALCDAGAQADRVFLVPSYAPDSSKLRARDAARRWAKFRTVPVGKTRHPEGDWIGGGKWRERFLPNSEAWPGAWTTMERATFLSSDPQIFWKYEGLGPYGQGSHSKAEALAEAGWSAPVVGAESGFLGYQWLPARHMRARDMDAMTVARIAAYCAFRAKSFAREVSAASQEDLSTMLRVNFEREFQGSIPFSVRPLDVLRPTVCDGKMSPHEWLHAEGGRLLKIDATVHGDDHFFPGPCDIAWDLAGAIVEWEMDPAARELLLREYRNQSDDDVSMRIDAYLLGYSIFRLAWCRTAAAGMRGTDDELRLLREYHRYRSYAEQTSAAAANRS